MKDLKVSLIQSEIVWQNALENQKMFSKKIESIEDTQIVLLPETFNTGFSSEARTVAEKLDGSTVTWMRDQATKNKIILGGSLLIEEDGLFYNRFIWMQPDGQFHYYNKRHLFSYGGEGDQFTAGDKRCIVSVNGWRINLQICYDLRFPVWSRLRTENEFDILLYIANWPEKRISAWDTLLKARSIENQCYTIGLNRLGIDGNGLRYSGSSQVIDPNGRIIENANQMETILNINLNYEKLKMFREKLPFQKDKDSFLVH